MQLLEDPTRGGGTVTIASVRTQWARHPADVARCVVAVIIAGLVVVIADVAPGTTISTSRDLVRLFDHTPSEFRDFIVGLIQPLAIAVPAVLVSALVLRRRFRLLGLLTLAALLASVVFALLDVWLASRVPRIVIEERLSKSWLTGALLGAGVFSATAAAIVLLFRLFTFWLPTLPGWAALQWTQRTGVV